MSIPWSQPGEPGRENDYYFNDVHELQQVDRAFAIGVYRDDRYMHGVVTYYTNGKTIRHMSDIESWRQETFAIWDADQLNPVQEIIIEGHKNTLRSVVDRRCVRTGTRTDDLLDPERSKEVVPATVLHPPSRQWNLRGFWGCSPSRSEGAGFSQLGVLWGKTADRGRRPIEELSLSPTFLKMSASPMSTPHYDRRLLPPARWAVTIDSANARATRGQKPRAPSP